MATVDIVIKELKKKLNISKLDEYDIIDVDIVKSLLKEDGIYLLDEYADKVQTPFGLAWYYENWNLQTKYTPLIERDLHDLLDEYKVNFNVYNDFTFRVRIDKKTKIDEGKQSLIIKACINEEDGKTEISYKIVGPEGWGWNITKQQLKALTENEIVIKEENNKVLKRNFWKRLFRIK